MGALQSLLHKSKVSPILFYEISWQLLGIQLSFLAELTNLKMDFRDIKPDSCTRSLHIFTLHQVHQERLQWPWSPKIMVSFFQRLVDKMEMRQLFDNPFTALQSASKMRWSHHKQIQAATFVGQTTYCIISNQSCIISSQTTVLCAGLTNINPTLFSGNKEAKIQK